MKLTIATASLVATVASAGDHHHHQQHHNHRAEQRQPKQQRQALRASNTQKRILGVSEEAGSGGWLAPVSTIVSTTTTNVTIECGAIIDSDVTLEEDLTCSCAERGPGSTYAALTVVGPATLDLNGFTVSCENNYWDTTLSDGSAVVGLAGSNAKIVGGTVIGGNYGVALGGDGRHVVAGVRVANTANDGVVITSSFNEVSGCQLVNNGWGYYPVEEVEDDDFAAEFCPEGYVISAGPSGMPSPMPSGAPSATGVPSAAPSPSPSATTLSAMPSVSSAPTVSSSPTMTNSTAPLNPGPNPCYNSYVSGDAIDIPLESANHNVIRDNIISGYGDDGISSLGSYNIFMNNDITADPSDGRGSRSDDAIMIRGVGNQIIGNVITSPVDDGIDVRYTNGDIECDTSESYVGGYNTIRDNVVNAPVQGKGIKISSDSNFVVGNTANGALSDEGINVDSGDCGVGGNQNYLADNSANDNSDEGIKVEASNNNVLVRNTADGNGMEGLLLQMDGGRGVGNVFAGNLGQDTNGDDDIKVDGGNGAECTTNAFVGNGITGEGDDPCTLYGADIDLRLQD